MSDTEKATITILTWNAIREKSKKAISWESSSPFPKAI